MHFLRLERVSWKKKSQKEIFLKRGEKKGEIQNCVTPTQAWWQFLMKFGKEAFDVISFLLENI